MTPAERYRRLVEQRAAQGLGPTMRADNPRLRSIFERLADAVPAKKAS